jgi:hypothetical protein
VKVNNEFFLPPAARGALFEKTAPLDPRQKLFIKGDHSLQPGRIFMQTMTAFDSFKVRMLKRRLKASIPSVQATFHQLHDISAFYCICCQYDSFKEAFRRPKGPYRSPMPWGSWPPEEKKYINNKKKF